jgi:hypothetical protein
MARDPTRGAGDTQVDAFARVQEASAERSRLSGEREGAKGTARELESEVLLRAANDEVAARERWLQWIEERDY